MKCGECPVATTNPKDKTDCYFCPFDKVDAFHSLHDCSHLSELVERMAELLKEQDERLRKLQKDKDNLCLEISELKHKFHDAPPKFVSQGVVNQIRWERDTALSQLEQIGKGLGSKMDDIVALLKEQVKTEVVFKEYNGSFESECGNCGQHLDKAYSNCPKCHKALDWNKNQS